MERVVAKRPLVLAFDMRTKLSRSEKREAISFYITVFPWILGFCLFTTGPMIASLVISLLKWDMILPAKFIGFQNYVSAFHDPVFWKSLYVTSVYTFVSVPLGLILSLFVALLLNQKIKGLSIFRTLFYLPSLVTGAAVSILWVWVFNPNFGLLNTFLSYLGIQGPQWIYSPRWALPSLIIMSLWSIGGSMLIYLSGLQGIPTELYEAAEIDGAGSVHKFWSVTLPMISPVIFFNLVMGIIGTFQVFTQGYVMTQGGPEYSTMFYVLYLYNNAFQEFQMGYASALAWILFFIILILTIIVFKTSKTWVYYDGSDS